MYDDDRLDPQTIHTLEQLIKLHGSAKLIQAIYDIQGRLLRQGTRKDTP